MRAYYQRGGASIALGDACQGSGVRFTPGATVVHVGSDRRDGLRATVLVVDCALDPDEDQVTVEYTWKGERKTATLSAWRLRLAV